SESNTAGSLSRFRCCRHPMRQESLVRLSARVPRLRSGTRERHERRNPPVFALAMPLDPRFTSTPASGHDPGPISVRRHAMLAVLLLAACGDGGSSTISPEQAAIVEQGKQIFRFDTIDDEVRWIDELRMHEVIIAAVDPMTALSVGLKVD